jgi:RNA polymerase sigma-32 factor
MTSQQVIPPIDQGLRRYFAEIAKFPILERGEEYALAVRYRSNGDLAAARQLIGSHLRLVAKMVMKFRGYGLPLADMVSEGNLGLMKAVARFDPERGNRLSTCAMWWIRAAITEYVLDSWSMVRLGSAASRKKLFFSLRRAKVKLGIFDSGDLTAEQAASLGSLFKLPAKTVAALNGRMMCRDASLNAPLSADNSNVEFQDSLVDGGPSPEAIVADREERRQRLGCLRDALGQLPPRDRYIVSERYLKERAPTLDSIGRKLGISRERVRQIEVRAVDSLRHNMLGDASGNAVAA